ncbi:MAG TPA: hypothetical protein VMZ06_08400 [Candidatus Bathyarchaeia archaeon]|nr:hypothetical protein [Candidatus Bathyarchaeia archaeon]
MRKITDILLVVTIAAVGVVLTGCPEDGNDEEAWILEMGTTVVQGVDVTVAQIMKFYDDGRFTIVVDYLLSGTGWSGQMRGWVSGTYTISGGNITLSYAATACQDVAAKMVIQGIILNSAEADTLADMFYTAQFHVYTTAQQQPNTMSYSVAGDTMYLDTTALSRYDDSYDYADPTWTSCP